MAKVTIPEREVTICDLCEREAKFLQTCLVCEKSFCRTCEGIITGCITMPNACRPCAKRDDVEKIVLAAAGQMAPIIKRRNAKLRKLTEECSDATERTD